MELEDPANEPNYEHLLQLGVSPEKAPDTPEYVTLHFEKGVCTAVNGKEMGPVEMLTTLNELGGKNGIGIQDICENRVVGMKSRGVYETPGGSILYYAHRELEYLTLGTLRKAVQEGDVKNGTVMAGQIAGLISKEQTCKEMIEEMMDQTEKLLGRC